MKFAGGLVKHLGLQMYSGAAGRIVFVYGIGSPVG
jgi:hypothetical protein